MKAAAGEGSRLEESAKVGCAAETSMKGATKSVSEADFGAQGTSGGTAGCRAVE